jgi:ppGpp synthetase/RelA/SpoT-type nucleotidyltranferase
VNEIIKPLIKKHSDRFFCRIDDTHPIKTPASIIEKILRSRTEAEKKKDKGKLNKDVVYSLDNFVDEMTDLARFRIVCNFLEDVFEVSESIRNSTSITKFFNESKFDDTINLHKRTKGERSLKLILKHKSQPHIYLEIQIMTQLQEAWDKKDHYLVYEKKRSSQKSDDDNFPTYLDAKMSAMAELLYIADDYFNQLQKEANEKEEGEL